MPRTVKITTPWPNLEREAKRFGIPKRRQRELRELAGKYLEQLHSEEKAAAGKTMDGEEKRKNASAAD